MLETLPKAWLAKKPLEKLPEAKFLKKDESKEDVPAQEPPEDPWDPNKLFEILESTTYNIAENRQGLPSNIL